MLEQGFFQRQRALLCRQEFVFKGFEFGRDEALGVFQRLAALVIGRRLLRLIFRQFNIKPVHAVVFHFQCGQLGALPFALFQFAQRVVAVRLQMAQFVQFGVVAVVDDAAIFQPHGRLGQQSSLQQLGNVLRFGKAACKRVQQAALRQMNILQD